MKIIILFLGISIFYIVPSLGQNLALGIHTGFAEHFGKDRIVGIPVGINVEWALDTRHAISGRAHFSIGPRNQDPHIYYLSPEYKYYLTGETLDGFYLGAYAGFGGTNRSGYVSFGSLVGYSLQIKQKLNIECNIQTGYGRFLDPGTTVFHLVPTFGLRFEP